MIISVVSSLYFSVNAIEFSIKLGMGMKCSSRHTFAPIDSTFCTRIYLLASGALGRPTIGHNQPRGGPLTPLYWSVHLPARLVEAQLPPIREEAQLPPFYPGIVPVGPGEARLPVCLLHTGLCTTMVVGFFFN